MRAKFIYESLYVLKGPSDEEVKEKIPDIHSLLKELLDLGQYGNVTGNAEIIDGKIHIEERSIYNINQIHPKEIKYVVIYDFDNEKLYLDKTNNPLQEYIHPVSVVDYIDKYSFDSEDLDSNEDYVGEIWSDEPEHMWKEV